MLKKHLKPLILTSLVTVLPLLAGLLLWNQLPDTLNIHWDASGNPNGTAGKAVAVFALPLIMLALHLLATLDTLHRNKHQSPKVQSIALWLCPVLSLITNGTVYTIALGLDFDMSRVLFLLLAIMFVVMGNYMPKFRQNPTLGIKTTWALADEENWNATHRFAGKLWLGTGLAMLILSFLPFTWSIGVIFVIILVAGFLPMIYSWQFYRKKKASGVDVKAAPAGYSKWAWLFIVTVLIILVLVLFTGNITYTFGEDALAITSNRMGGITVSYDSVDTLELREEEVAGSRTLGYGSLRLLLGAFSNEEFGDYTRYTYFNANPCIIVTAGENTLVLSGEDEAATRLLYQQLLEKVG